MDVTKLSCQHTPKFLLGSPFVKRRSTLHRENIAFEVVSVGTSYHRRIVDCLFDQRVEFVDRRNGVGFFRSLTVIFGFSHIMGVAGRLFHFITTIVLHEPPVGQISWKFCVRCLSVNDSSHRHGTSCDSSVRSFSAQICCFSSCGIFNQQHIVRFWLPVRLQSALDVLRCVLSGHRGHMSRGFCRWSFARLSFCCLCGRLIRTGILHFNIFECKIFPICWMFRFWGFVIAIYDARLR